MLYLWNQKNCKTYKPHVLILKFTNKLDLKQVKKVLIYQILVFIITHGKT